MTVCIHVAAESEMIEAYLVPIFLFLSRRVRPRTGKQAPALSWIESRFSLFGFLCFARLKIMACGCVGMETLNMAVIYLIFANDLVRWERYEPYCTFPCPTYASRNRV